MESNARFVIGVFLQDPNANPLTYVFQRDLFGQDSVAVTVTRAEAERLGPSQLAGAITDYYLQQYPAEVERVGRETVLGAVGRAVK